MGAEDFSYVLDQLPGAMLFLGGHARPTAIRRTGTPNHSLVRVLRRVGDGHRDRDLRGIALERLAD